MPIALRGALVLAGGRSTRFGSNKAIATLGGKPLFVYVVKAAMHVAREVVLAIGRENSINAYRELSPPTVRIVKDRPRAKSPLVGIFTGFQAIRSEYAAILSCDTPLVDEDVLRLLFTRADGADAAVPKWPNGDIEPLQSVYRVESAIPKVKQALRRHEYGAMSVIKRLDNVAYVPVRDIRQVNKRLSTFFNVNRPSDMRRAEALLLGFKPGRAA